MLRDRQKWRRLRLLAARERERDRAAVEDLADQAGDSLEDDGGQDRVGPQIREPAEILDADLLDSVA